jgi:plastocyanin
MRLRAIAAAVLAAGVLAAPASAATTRWAQAVDGSGGQKYWAPNAIPAQVGDTIQWRFSQPGNPNAGTHDIWIVAPGGTPQQLGVSYSNPTVEHVVDQPGTYQFYCSIHGGLATGGMNGTITVGADDPGPPVDPGTPWNAPDPVIDTGPAAYLNPSLAPTVFETGDLIPPTVSLVSLSGVTRGARVRVRVSKPGSVTVRLQRGSKLIAKRKLNVKAYVTKGITVRASKAMPTTRLRVVVQTTDQAGLESATESAQLWVGR